MTQPDIQVEHTNTTMVRLDLSDTNGQTTIGEIRRWLERCQDNGAHDETWAMIAYAPSLILGVGSYRPILAASIDHAKPAPAEAES